jgi:hypothetical protein
MYAAKTHFSLETHKINSFVFIALKILLCRGVGRNGKNPLSPFSPAPKIRVFISTTCHSFNEK